MSFCSPVKEAGNGEKGEAGTGTGEDGETLYELEASAAHKGFSSARFHI